MSQRNAVRGSTRLAWTLFVGLFFSVGLPAVARAGFADLYVGIRNGTDGVVRIDGATGNVLGTFASSGSTQGVVFGPNGNLFAASFNSDAVLQFDRTSGAKIGGNFTTGSPLGGNAGITFGPDGNLYAASFNDDKILRFNGQTGVFDKVFATGVSTPDGLVFGPDGNLYVGDTVNNRINRYDGATGNFIDVFATGPALDYPGQFAFGPDGNLYVSSFDTNAVVLIDGSSGIVLNSVFASVQGPSGLAFGPDGDLYVASFTNGTIGHYNGMTGAFRQLYATGLSGGPTFITFVPEPSSLILTALGAAGLTMAARRRAAKHKS